MTIPWHRLTVEEVLERLKTSLKGLDEEEAKKRLEIYGYNEIPERKARGPLSILLDQFKSILVLLLLVSTAASFALGEIKDGTAILAIVVINAVLGFIQEYRAEKAVEMLKKLAAPKAVAVRSGVERVLPTRELVPGDIIVLKSGDRVPADARVVEAVNLKVDEAILTGESIPVSKISDPIPTEALQIADMRNIVFMGTLVTYGRGKAVVVATGTKTAFGKIAEAVQREEKEETPLQRKMEHFGRILVAAVFILTLIVFLDEFFFGVDLFEAFMTAVSLAVSAVPEGLPAVVTVTLALGVQRMARRNAIVRRLSAVEGLGSVTVICSDKTGTITKNEMTVVEVYADFKEIRVTGAGYSPVGEFYYNGTKIDPLQSPTLSMLLQAAVLCNDAKLHREENEWKIIGDPTEGALVVLAAKARILKEDYEKKYPRVDEIPFESERKRMTTIHDVNGERYAFMKGAPEVVISLCSKIMVEGYVRDLTEDDRKKILSKASHMADRALRVLALAYRKLHDNIEKGEVESSMVFLGLVGMIDPPRPEVKKAVQTAKSAGVDVIMITGDHKATAVAIAKEVGIMEGDDYLALTGDDLDKMSDEELYKIVDKVKVYARVSPEHKLRIVKLLKKKGHVVAMTGDGVNDAPAVKLADIGIAMGRRGSDVTREVADIILADDNFATIVAAIEEGRGIYENIRKFLRLLLSANWDEILVVFVCSMLDLPIPFTPLQILWINLLTDGLPALALGLDPPAPDVMKRPPRDPEEPIYRGMELFIAFSAALALFAWITPFWIALSMGRPLKEARSIAFTQAVLFELILSFNCRSEREYAFKSIKLLTANKYLVLAVFASLVLQLTVIYVPFLQQFFKTLPLTTWDWAMVLCFATTSLLLYPGLFDTRRVYGKRVKLSSKCR
ncbi:MAG: ATPase [Thermoprotei archaeon]|nr:MAG: ATPase [Thermoprotei archaeon]